MGDSALEKNTTANDNTAFGSAALYLNTRTSNTAVGSGALDANTTADRNTGVGHRL